MNKIPDEIVWVNHNQNILMIITICEKPNMTLLAIFFSIYKIQRSKMKKYFWFLEYGDYGSHKSCAGSRRATSW